MCYTQYITSNDGKKYLEEPDQRGNSVAETVSTEASREEHP
jgi:hypothetical protein